MQFIGNTLQRTDRVICQRMDIIQYLYLCRSQDRSLFGLTNLRIIQHIQITGHIASKILQIHFRTGRNGKGYQYPGYSRMNARFQE